jgi:hypothetical protein
MMHLGNAQLHAGPDSSELIYYLLSAYFILLIFCGVPTQGLLGCLPKHDFAPHLLSIALLLDLLCYLRPVTKLKYLCGVVESETGRAFDIVVSAISQRVVRTDYDLI